MGGQSFPAPQTVPSYPLAGGCQLFQQEGDGDLQQGLPEELLSHGAAVVVKFLWGERVPQVTQGLAAPCPRAQTPEICPPNHLHRHEQTPLASHPSPQLLPSVSEPG